MAQVKKMGNRPGYFAGWVKMPKTPYLHDLIAKQIDQACHALRKSTKGVSAGVLKKQSAACRWFVEGMYQGFCCLPRLPLALPRRSNEYKQLPFGYDVVDRVLNAALHLKFIGVKNGFYAPSGEGFVSRIRPLGAMLSHFHELVIQWQLMPVPKPEESIRISVGRVKRRIATHLDRAGVMQMRKNLDEINKFLSKQCISIELSNKRFTDPVSTVISAKSKKVECINFQNIFLTRIFAFEGLNPGDPPRGGRFYGGWWQHIRKELRPHILINGFSTAECDFSAMSLNCLYALEEIDIGSDDPYDIGIKYYPDDPRRESVKKYINALLNDKENRFRLCLKRLRGLGVSNFQLRRMVEKRHGAVKHHFGSGIGLHLQYLDSKVAERVMLRFAQMNEVCLPVHDSFIVRVNCKSKLEQIMREEFSNILHATIKTKTTILYGEGELSRWIEANKVRHGPNKLADLTRVLTELHETFSYVLGYTQSWERQMFTPEEIGLRDRAEQLRFDEARGK